MLAINPYSILLAILGVHLCNSMKESLSNLPEGVSLSLPPPPDLNQLHNLNTEDLPSNFRFRQASTAKQQDPSLNTLSDLNLDGFGIPGAVSGSYPVDPLYSSSSSAGSDPVVQSLINSLDQTVSSVSPGYASQGSWGIPGLGFGQGDASEAGLIAARNQELARLSQLDALIKSRESAVGSAQSWLSMKRKQIQQWIVAQTSHAESLLSIEAQKVARLQAELKHLIEMHSQIAESINSANMEIKRRKTVLEMEGQKQALDSLALKENSLRENWEQAASEKSTIQELLKKSMNDISQSAALSNAANALPSATTAPVPPPEAAY